LKLKDKLEGRYTFEFDRHDDMVAPLIIRSSPGNTEDERDIFVLDLDEPRLLFTKVEKFPGCAMILGPVLMGREYSDSDEDAPPIVVYSLEDWSLMARFTNTHLGSDELYPYLRNCQVYKHFILIVHVMYHKTAPGVIQTWFDIWDIQGTQRGEILFPKEGFVCDAFHSHAGNHYLTIHSSPWVENGPETVQTWDLERMELTYEYAISQDDMDKGYSCEPGSGIVYLWAEKEKPFEYWTVDGRPVSRKVAKMEWESFSCHPGMFSDGSRIVTSKWLTLYTKEGDVVKRYNVKSEDDYYLEAGVLFDRFFFSISWREKSKSASLVVYSKTGEKLAWTRLRVRGRYFSWFIDISERLVLVWDARRYVETVDFRGLLQ
jgi:hypothetical protein